MKVLKVISIIICILLLGLSLLGLVLSIGSINGEGMAKLGVIFLLPSCISITIILFDLLISIDLLKIGITYSFASTIIKLGFALLINSFVPYELQQTSIGNLSNLNFFSILIILLIVALIPSTVNIFKLMLRKKKISA